jgi:hypothetical protein
VTPCNPTQVQRPVYGHTCIYILLASSLIQLRLKQCALPKRRWCSNYTALRPSRQSPLWAPQIQKERTDLRPYGLVDEYRRFGETCCLHIHCVHKEININTRSRDSVWLRIGDRKVGVRVLVGSKFSRLHVEIGSGAHPASHPVGTGGAVSHGVKRHGREADHSPTSAEIKKTWLYTSTPLYTFMEQCLIS